MKIQEKSKIKGYRVCPITGKDTEGETIKKSDADFLKKNEWLWKVSDEAQKAMNSGMTFVCKGENCYTKEPCNNIVVFDIDEANKKLPFKVKAGDHFEGYGCPSCTPTKKFCLTKEEVNKSYDEFNAREVLEQK